MKNLKGMKAFSSFENKKLMDLKLITGGANTSYAIKSNVSCGDGCSESDVYDDSGSYKFRATLQVGELTPP
jgi:putative peptide modification target (TIGR04139 family)